MFFLVFWVTCEIFVTLGRDSVMDSGQLSK
jgi:hypothetical protein